MKKEIILVSLLLFVAIIYAQLPQWLWVQGAGGVMEDCAYDLVTDSDGNIYVTGEFRGTATFGSIEIVSEAYVDVFIAKADPNGNWLWANCAQGTDSERGYDISIDNSGNCYIIGHFQGTATFGDISITSIDNFDVFVAKADAEGNWLWVKRCGAMWGNAIDTDEDGSCYITGYFGLTSNGDFGSTTLTCLGSYDNFVAKLDTDGNWLWAVQAGGVSEDYCWGISVDSNGNSYIAGYFNTPSISHIAYFGDIELLSDSGYDIFVAKLDPYGNWLWAVNEGDDGHDYCYGITTTANGVSYIIGEQMIPSYIGSTDMSYSGTYVAGIDSNGNWLWAAETDGAASRYGKDVCTDVEGNCYATGYFFGDAYFGDFTLENFNTTTDVFVAKVNPSGQWIWADNTGGGSSELGNGIAIDDSGDIYVTGKFNYTFYCDSSSISSVGSYDVFVAKMGHETPVEDELIPALNKLNVYPNPFKTSSAGRGPEASIDFSLQKDAYVELAIYNIKGQKVITLVNQFLENGNYSHIWSGNDAYGIPVTSGIYLLKLQINDSVVATKRCLLIK